jgi:hypothetical protein
MSLLGLTKDHQQVFATTEWETTLQRLRAAPGKEGLTTLVDSLLHAETTAHQEEMLPYAGPGMVHCLQASVTLNKATTYPLPTTEDWQEASTADHDLAVLIRVLTQGEAGKLEKARLTEKSYYDEWAGGRLETENNIVYCYEVKRRPSLHQLRVRVVPPKLQ